MKVYMLYLSEDGLMSNFATTAAGIAECVKLSEYNVNSIEYYINYTCGLTKYLHVETLPYNLTNLRKALREAGGSITLTTPDGSSITLTEHIKI